MSEQHFVGQVTQKALIEKDGQYLLITYPEGDVAAGLWDMPGGRLNEGEFPEEGLRREVREEIGVEIELGPIFATATFTNMSRKRNFLVVYRASLIESNTSFIFEKGKVERADWFTKEEVEKLPIIYPEYKEVLAQKL